MEGIEIREMTGGDAREVARLEALLFTDPWSEDMFRQECEGRRGSWDRVAVGADRTIVGYLVAWFVADEIHLANIAVVPELRRRGLAQRFLDLMEAEGQSRHCRLVILEVRRSNRAARALYKKNGYYTVSIRERYYQDNHEDALVMIKPLSTAGPSASARKD